MRPQSRRSLSLFTDRQKVWCTKCSFRRRDN